MTTPAHPVPSSRRQAGRWPLLARLNGVGLALLGCALVAKLWPDWCGDPDLSHGFITPVACLLLLIEARRTGGAMGSGLLGSRAAIGLTIGAGAGGLGMLAVAGLFAAAVDWSSALVDFCLACSFSLAALAALAAFADRRAPLFPLNWSSFLAAVLWPLGAPIPPGTYTRLTLALQLNLSAGVLHTLHILGIAARRTGNIIELAHGSVGVEDACSGVRSLVSCVFAGVLLSGTLVRSPWRRALLIGISAPLALAMNFGRSLVLTLLVERGVDIRGTWHEVTGYAVLALTAALLALAAVGLGRGGSDRVRDGGPGAPEEGPERRRRTAAFPQLALAGVLALGLALVLTLRASTRQRPVGGDPGPDLEALVPAQAPGWAVTTPAIPPESSGVLRTGDLLQRTYARRDGRGVLLVTLYVAHWRAGQVPVSLVAAHTPDACWPGAGWVADPRGSGREVLAVSGRRLPEAERRVFSNQGLEETVWFWHLHGGRPLLLEDPRSPAALLRLAWRYGWDPGGDQLFVRVSGNRPWGELAAQPFVAGLFAQLRPLGL